MAGLNKIIGQIAADAQAYESQVINEAREKAQELLKEGQDQAEALCMEIAEKSRGDIKSYHERITSSADFQRRTAILKTKQEIIAQVIEKAYQSLAAEEPGKYFAFIEKMLRKFALPKEGEIYFSQKDLSRIPQGFDETIHNAALANGGILILKQEPKAIENGFILVYGGIEENCTLKAVFDARKEVLQDLTNKLLFSQEQKAADRLL